MKRDQPILYDAQKKMKNLFYVKSKHTQQNFKNHQYFEQTVMEIQQRDDHDQTRGNFGKASGTHEKPISNVEGQKQKKQASEKRKSKEEKHRVGIVNGEVLKQQRQREFEKERKRERFAAFNFSPNAVHPTGKESLSECFHQEYNNETRKTSYVHRVKTENYIAEDLNQLKRRALLTATDRNMQMQMMRQSLGNGESREQGNGSGHRKEKEKTLQALNNIHETTQNQKRSNAHQLQQKEALPQSRNKSQRRQFVNCPTQYGLNNTYVYLRDRSFLNPFRDKAITAAYSQSQKRRALTIPDLHDGSIQRKRNKRNSEYLAAGGNSFEKQRGTKLSSNQLLNLREQRPMGLSMQRQKQRLMERNYMKNTFSNQNKFSIKQNCQEEGGNNSGQPKRYQTLNFYKDDEKLKSNGLNASSRQCYSKSGQKLGHSNSPENKQKLKRNISHSKQQCSVNCNPKSRLSLIEAQNENVHFQGTVKNKSFNNSQANLGIGSTGHSPSRNRSESTKNMIYNNTAFKICFIYGKRLKSYHQLPIRQIYIDVFPHLCATFLKCKIHYKQMSLLEFIYIKDSILKVITMGNPAVRYDPKDIINIGSIKILIRLLRQKEEMKEFLDWAEIVRYFFIPSSEVRSQANGNVMVEISRGKKQQDEVSDRDGEDSGKDAEDAYRGQRGHALMIEEQAMKIPKGVEMKNSTMENNHPVSVVSQKESILAYQLEKVKEEIANLATTKFEVEFGKRDLYIYEVHSKRQITYFYDLLNSNTKYLIGEDPEVIQQYECIVNQTSDTNSFQEKIKKWKSITNEGGQKDVKLRERPHPEQGQPQSDQSAPNRLQGGRHANGSGNYSHHRQLENVNNDSEGSRISRSHSQVDGEDGSQIMQFNTTKNMSNSKFNSLFEQFKQKQKLKMKLPIQKPTFLMKSQPSFIEKQKLRKECNIFE